MRQDEITCNYCAQSGHIMVDCDSRKEIRDSRDRSGHDTHEKDRSGTNDVKDLSKPSEPINTEDDNNLHLHLLIPNTHLIVYNTDY